MRNLKTNCFYSLKFHCEIRRPRGREKGKKGTVLKFHITFFNLNFKQKVKQLLQSFIAEIILFNRQCNSVFDLQTRYFTDVFSAKAQFWSLSQKWGYFVSNKNSSGYRSILLNLEHVDKTSKSSTHWALQVRFNIWLKQ